MSILWLNGKLLDESEANVPALDRGVQWGYGLFETMRVYGGDVCSLDEHYERLCSGGEVISLVVPELETLRDAVTSVLEANRLAEAGVRITMTAGAGPADPHHDPTEPPNVIVTAWPVRDYSDLYKNGAALITIPGGGRPLSAVKTTSYAVSVAGRIFAARAGADDALFLGHDGRVLEATGSNVFVATGAELRTPPVDDGLLSGVTRRHVIDVARASGFEVVEEPVYPAALFTADEVVGTSSLREVYPVRSVDGRELHRADVARTLREAYRSAVVSSR